MKNYIDLGPCDFGRRELMAFMDTEAYHSIEPLRRRNVRMKFKSEIRRAGYKYHLIYIRVLNKDIPRFKEAMEDLKRNMLICGHTDYEAEAGEIMSGLEKVARKTMG